MADAGMLDHLNLLRSRPVDVAPAPLPPVEPVPAPVPTPVATPAPVTAAESNMAPTSATLRNWLLMDRSGLGTLSPEMYAAYGGDDILAQMQKYDPNARWVPTAMNEAGNEAGTPSGVTGFRLDFDPNKLPAVGGPGGGKSLYETGLVPVYDNSELYNPAMVYDDPYYGRMTVARNVVKGREPWWTYAAPIAVSLLAPYAGAALAGAGIGAAGGTAAVTGAAAGLGAGNIAMGGPTSWWSTLLKKTPNVARQVGEGNFNPTALAASTAANAFGLPSGVGEAATAAWNTWNPRNYGSSPGGTAKKPDSNDSQLVATQFADDPYRSSQ